MREKKQYINLFLYYYIYLYRHIIYSKSFNKISLLLDIFRNFFMKFFIISEY